MNHTQEDKEKFDEIIDNYNIYCKEYACDDSFESFITEGTYKEYNDSLTSNEKKEIIKYYSLKQSMGSPLHSSSQTSSRSSSISSPQSTSSSNERYQDIIDNYNSYCESFGLTGDNYLSFEEYIESGQYKIMNEELNTKEKKQLIKYYTKTSSLSSPTSLSSSISSTSSLSTHTLLLNCCHGNLNVYYRGKPYVELAYMYNPIQHLHRLIQGAQLCITSMYVSDVIKLIKELDTKSWDSLNKDNISEITSMIANLKSYKNYKQETEGYDYKARKHQIHNTLEIVSNKFNDKILNKEWSIHESSQPETTPLDKVEDINGLYFVSETTFIVPRMDSPYINNSTELTSHFNFTTREITYPKFYNILLCPIYRQYNDYKLSYYYPQGIAMKRDWAYNYNITNIGYYNMISKTTADVLYNYLVNIPNVSMIDNSCESHVLKSEVNELKELKEKYRKEYGPKLAKKKIKETNKKIYRLTRKISSKARGKKNITKIYGKRSRYNTRRKR